ncbi:MAG: PQQ-dependent sugar dehydrogenase [Planctomycetota bacterium]|nr:PQQ-dependent sugar dehydrogenase [Planctomycetota bacterium]
MSSRAHARPGHAVSAVALVCAGLACAAPASAQVATQTLVTGLARPLFVTQAPGDNDRLFIVEQRSSTTGRVRIYKQSTSALLATPFISVLNVTTGSEQGLLGLAFHPKYNLPFSQGGGYFFLNYTNSGGGAAGKTNIFRFRVNATNPDLADTTTNASVLQINQPFNNHNGGWMGFGPDAMLYIASGDGGSGNDPNNAGLDITNQLLGKMLRLDVDGPDNVPGNSDDDGFAADNTRLYTIPSNNPFVGVTGDDEIWHFGLRNPWRDSFDRLTGEMWIADVGQVDREEVNRVAAHDDTTSFGQPGYQGGKNFGWRVREGFRATGLSAPADAGPVPYLDPVFDYDHGADIPPVNNTGCSITGGYVYRGCKIPSLWGKYIFGDYCSGWVHAYDPATGTSREVINVGFGLVSFGEDNNGELYVVLSNAGANVGEVRRIVSTVALVDCNANGCDDAIEIASGSARDRNADSIPDECTRGCPADVTADTFLDFTDFDAFVEDFEAGSRWADFTGDGFLDFTDFDAFVEAFEAGCGN